MNKLFLFISSFAFGFCVITQSAYATMTSDIRLYNAEEVAAFRSKHPAHCEKCECVFTPQYFPHHISFVHMGDYPDLTTDCLQSLTFVNIFAPRNSELIDYKRLPQFTHIKKLTLMPLFKQMTGEDVSKCTHLISLSLDTFPISDEDLDSLTNLTDLDIGQGNDKLTGKSLSTTLTSLTLSRNKHFTNESLKRLSGLTSLNVTHENALKADGLASLGALIHLSLYKTNIEITPDVARSLPNLTSLKISEDKITDPALSAFTQLRFLALSHNGWVTDQAFHSLPNISELTLAYCQRGDFAQNNPTYNITAAILPYLPKLTKFIGIGHDSITAEQAAPFYAQSRIPRSNTGQVAILLLKWLNRTNSEFQTQLD